MRGLADWWDAGELWVTQLPFVFQVLLLIVVLLPLAGLLVAGVDRLTSRFDVPPSRRGDRADP